MRTGHAACAFLASSANGHAFNISLVAFVKRRDEASATLNYAGEAFVKRPQHSLDNELSCNETFQPGDGSGR